MTFGVTNLSHLYYSTVLGQPRLTKSCLGHVDQSGPKLYKRQLASTVTYALSYFHALGNSKHTASYPSRQGGSDGSYYCGTTA